MLARHLLLILMIGGALPAVAGESHDQALRLRERGEVQPLEQILARARERHPGRVVETELERHRGRYVYEIKIAGDDGVVHELQYDARTAELLKVERED